MVAPRALGAAIPVLPVPPVTSRRRIGIVLSEFGIPSEIWALRQAEAFEQLEPIYFAATRREGGLPLPEGRELILLGPEQRGVLRRAQRKLGFGQGALPSRGWLARMRQALLRARLDVVLCHFAWNAVAVAAAAGDVLPVIAHVHGRDVSAHLRWPANRRALQRALPGFSAVVAVGQHQVRILKELDSAVEPQRIPCGAPTGMFAVRPLPERTEDAPLVFISVGRISPEKGTAETLTAFEQVAADLPEARLVLVGDGPDRSEIAARVENSRFRDRIHMPGMLPPERVAEELPKAHVFLQHSRPIGGWIEGFPVALTEAGAAGLPIISTRVGGIPEQLFDGENGYLLEPGDVDGQIRAMRQLAGDEALRQRMGARAREIAVGFDSALQTAKLEAAILAALSDAPEPDLAFQSEDLRG